MADLVQFSITRISNANMNVPRWSIAGKIVDSQAQASVVADFSGVNAVTFPTVLGQLTQAQQDRLVELIVRQILEFKFGV